jgi:aldose 1-epimerase
MSIAVSEFGQFNGKRVDQYHLRSDTGVEIDIIGYGAAVRDWRVPVAGGLRSVALGFDSFEPYPEHSPHFGAITGRVANRIVGASFDLDGQHYDLPVNEGNIHLHGGPEGLGRQVWAGEVDSAGTSVRFTLHSPDGAMGYPGNVDFAVTYRLVGNRLRTEFEAIPDRRTPISLVQHQYWNLGTDPLVLDHWVQIPSSAYTQLGPDLCPTGAILPSRGTQYDLRAGRILRDAAGAPIDYDINLVLDTGRDLADPIATVRGPDGALTLQLWSDRPGLQFYNGVMTNVAVPGLNGRRYPKHSGFCLEDQTFPDALHNPHFPSIIHGPDKPYRHWCEIEIG